jgi:hypothetical protein
MVRAMSGPSAVLAPSLVTEPQLFMLRLVSAVSDARGLSPSLVNSQVDKLRLVSAVSGGSALTPSSLGYSVPRQGG